jgi:isopenicillin N synthase-like dioxygenase
MDLCASRLLEAFSIYLGQDANYLPDMAQDGSSIIRVIHYPVCEGFDEPGVMRAAQHEDINLMTLLPESTASGLELLTRDGEWLPIHAIEGQMIVDTGDMMRRITNTTIPATTHRVVNPGGAPTPRYSMPFFVHPHPDAMLEVLESCIGEGEEAKFEPITSEEFLMERLREIGLKK